MPYVQGLLNGIGADSGYYGYKTDVSVPVLPGAEVPKGGLNVVFFGYRSCGTVCPLQLLNLKALHEHWQGRAVQFVFVTLDPENDSQQELNRIMKALGPGFRAVRPGTFRQAQTLANEYGDFAAKHSGGQEINHGARLYVVAANNRRQLVYTTPELDLQRVNADIARLVMPGRS